MSDIATAFRDDEKPPADIPRLIAMSQRAVQLERQLELLEAEMSRARKEYLDLTRVQLPDVMAEIGLTSYQLSDGSKLKIEDMIEGSLPKDPVARHAAIDILQAAGGEAMIRSQVVLDFEKKQHNQAISIMRELQDRGLDVKLQEDVHHMTLKSFVREKLVHGEEIAFEKLGLFVGRRAVVRLPKEEGA